MSQERDMELIEDAIEARTVEAAIKETVDEMMRVTVTKLMHIYRAGKIDHDMLVGGVAELTALDNLMSNLESKQVRGIAASQKEYGNGKT